MAIKKWLVLEKKRKREKAELLRKREMLFAYGGIYKVQLGLNRDTIDGKMYQDLGVDAFIYYASMGLDMDVQKRSLQLFINQVMPEFT